MAKTTVAAQPVKTPTVAKAKIAKAKATPSTPTADKTPAAKADAPAEKRSGVNIGKVSGMRVMAYQDHTFEINDQPGRRLTNDELAADWRKEFPESKAVKAGRITGEMVAAVRSLYNRGTGGHGTPGQIRNSQPYENVNGQRVKVAAPTRKAAEPTPAPKAAAPKPQPTAAKTQSTAPKAEAAKTPKLRKSA